MVPRWSSLSPTDRRILAAIAALGPKISNDRLADVAGTCRTTLGTILRRLAERGALRRDGAQNHARELHCLVHVPAACRETFQPENTATRRRRCLGPLCREKHTFIDSASSGHRLCESCREAVNRVAPGYVGVAE